MQPRFRQTVGALMVLAAAGCQTSDSGKLHASSASKGARPGDWRVRLTWQTETESNAFGFYIYRSESADGEMKVVNPDAPLHAAGTTTTPQRYRYYDLEVDGGKTYYYKLEQVDGDGSSRFIIGEEQPVPGEPKRLTDVEVAEIREHGVMYRQEAG